MFVTYGSGKKVNQELISIRSSKPIGQAGQENQRILRSTPALLQHPAAPAMTALFFLHRDLSPRAALLGKPEARRGYQASSPTPQALWMAD